MGRRLASKHPGNEEAKMKIGRQVGQRWPSHRNAFSTCTRTKYTPLLPHPPLSHVLPSKPSEKPGRLGTFLSRSRRKSFFLAYRKRSSDIYIHTTYMSIDLSQSPQHTYGEGVTLDARIRLLSLRGEFQWVEAWATWVEYIVSPPRVQFTRQKLFVKLCCIFRREKSSGSKTPR
jgi:hypothetical protein